jgi:hypothetical protein
MRNQDNYTNSKQYILEQLVPYSNLDVQSEDFNILKMKLWTIDGPIREEEYIGGETPDQDVVNPMNHWDDLQNDLVYLDRYIRTEDNQLETDPPEKDFNEFWDQRIENKERFISREKDPEGDPGVTYEDWEQPYNQRPTRLAKSDFSDLYDAFKVKESTGDWETAFDITKKVTDYCIDIEAKSAENAILTNKTPEEIGEMLDENAIKNSLKNDYNYVVEMNKIYDEVWNIIKSVEPGIPDPPEEEEPTEENPDPDPVPEWSNSTSVIVNLPTKRLQVGLSAGHSSHKGPIIEELGTGGYRFSYRKSSDGTTISLPMITPIPPITFNNNVSPDLLGSLENNFNDWVYAHYYEEEDEGEITPYLNSLGVDKNSLPNGSDVPNSLTRERFDILNSRWETLNNLREYQIQNTGTRNIIESMLNAEIPDMLPDKEAHFVDRKNQKIWYTNILKERLGEFN